MLYSILGKTSIKASKLGFGTLRLPYEENNKYVVDERKSIELIRKGYEYGINYYDTAENYLNHQGEIILGKGLKGIRNNVNIATRISYLHLDLGIEEHISNCLKNLNTDYIDLLLIHAITDENWYKYKEANTIEKLDKLKQLGIIRHIGFSYHGSQNFFRSLLTEYDWDVAQIQHNYVDKNVQAGEEGVKFAHNSGIGTVVMSPLKGGILTHKLPSEIKECLNDVNSDLSYASWALKWLYEKEYVDIVLNGISSLEELDENVNIVNESNTKLLNKIEMEALDRARILFSNSCQILCTKCNYCNTCSQKINIPTIFYTYNQYLFEEDKNKYISYYLYLTKGKNKCIKCKQCEMYCPQKISISNKLSKIHEEFMSKINWKFR